MFVPSKIIFSTKINSRKGDWKLIVGNHEAPFVFPQVFEEPSKNNDWLVDDGRSFSGKFLEMFLHFTDLILGNNIKIFDNIIVKWQV